MKMSTQRMCSNCAFKLLRQLLGKRVLVKVGSDVNIGRLIAVEYKPDVPRLLDLVVTLQAGNTKVTLAEWNSLRVLKEGEVE